MSLFKEVQNFDRFNQADGKCSLCGHHPRKAQDGTRDRTFRSALHIHMEGPVEFCEHCLRDAAETIGWVDPRHMNVLSEAQEALVAALDTAEAELDEKSAAVSSLAGELARCAESAAAKQKAAWDRGYAQAQADAKVVLDAI